VVMAGKRVPAEKEATQKRHLRVVQRPQMVEPAAQGVLPDLRGRVPSAMETRENEALARRAAPEGILASPREGHRILALVVRVPVVRAMGQAGTRTTARTTTIDFELRVGAKGQPMVSSLGTETHRQVREGRVCEKLVARGRPRS
jgi:hypothetical protein